MRAERSLAKRTRGGSAVTERYLNRVQSRQYDELAIHTFGVPSIVLMENAARNCVDVMSQIGVEGPVLVVCGRGNNGGDGFAIARHLDLRGWQVFVVEAHATGAYSRDAQVNRAILQNAGWNLGGVQELDSRLKQCTWCVDALLGTGAKGEPRPPLGQVIESMNAASCSRIAVDIPSGLDCDSGNASRYTVHADHTCTFVAKKTGMQLMEAQDMCGEIHVVDVGAPQAVIEQLCQEA